MAAPAVFGPGLLPLEEGEQYRFTFDMSACIGCHSCEVACAEQNGLPVGVVWRRVGEVEGGQYPATRRFHLSMGCNHCLEPACMTGCPTNAYVKLPNGIVEQHADDCIGCQYCTWNCPYSVPVFQPDRRIVTKCDLCTPRLDHGLEPACVGACPTHAIGVETVDVAAWRADHHEADAPHLPSSVLTISTTRIIAPPDVPAETFAASDHTVRPEDPHWPLVWLTLLTQTAVGASAAVVLAGAGRAATVLAAVLAAVALALSLGHLGRPARAYKALRNLRRSWLSREVLGFGVFAALAVAAALVPSRPVEAAAALAGVAGVYASGRLYVVPGRPAWHTPLTVVAFAATGLALGPATVAAVDQSERRGLLAAAACGLVVQLGVLAANQIRLARDPRLEWHASHRLLVGRFRDLSVVRVAFGLVAIAVMAIGGPAVVALGVAAAGELIGRYLFYVTVVPLNMPGSFFRGSS